MFHRGLEAEMAIEAEKPISRSGEHPLAPEKLEPWPMRSTRLGGMAYLAAGAAGAAAGAGIRNSLEISILTSLPTAGMPPDTP